MIICFIALRKTHINKQIFNNIFNQLLSKRNQQIRAEPLQTEYSAKFAIEMGQKNLDTEVICHKIKLRRLIFNFILIFL